MTEEKDNGGFHGLHDLKQDKVSLSMNGEMTAKGTDRAAFAHVVGSIINSALFRVGVIVVLWKSPDIMDVLITAIEKW